MTEHYPLIEKVETVRGEDGDTVRVWYRVSSQEDTKKLFPFELMPGNWAVLVARVHSVRGSGGYTTGGRPPGATVERAIEKNPVVFGVEFRLDQGEIYLLPALASFSFPHSAKETT